MTVYIVMELCAGRSLDQELYAQTLKDKDANPRFPEAVASRLAVKMVKSLSYLHANGIVHRDVKASNFIFASNDTEELKLIDFGFSAQNMKKNATMTAVIGTPHFIAPQVLARSYTRACDLWSFGVVMFMMLTGQVPFPGSTKEQIFFRLSEDIQDSDALTERLAQTLRAVDLSETCIDFVCGLLAVDEAARLSAKQAMQHPWSKGEEKRRTCLRACRLECRRRLHVPPCSARSGGAWVSHNCGVCCCGLACASCCVCCCPRAAEQAAPRQSEWCGEILSMPRATPRLG